VSTAPSFEPIEMSASRVRALRGKESRAAFARKVGVTAQSVYRWELADGATEARRPRGEVLERLQRLAAGSRPESARPVSAGDATALSAAIGAFARLMQGEWREAEPELLRALMAGVDVSEDAAAVGGAGLAFAEVFLRADARAALAAVGPAVASAGHDRLTPGVAAIVYAVAALAHALPDARFFDLGRVHAYQARVEALAGRGGSTETRLLAALAAGWAAVVSGDHDLLVRAYEGLDLVSVSEPPLALALMIGEAMGFRALLLGRAAEAVRTFEALAERAATAGAPLVEARILGSLAGRQLEDLGPPERALETARRALALERTARAVPGLHTVFAARAEVEALFRLGRLDEARAALGTLDGYWRDSGLPPTAAISVYVRISYLCGDLDGLAATAERLRACTVPAVDRLARACADYLEATHSMGTAVDGPATLAAFDHAEREGARWPFLRREIVTWRPMVFVMDPDLPQPEAALRQAQRILDAFPSPWNSAHLRRIEGLIRATRGEVAEGRRLLEASIATFEAAGCQPDVALTKCALALTRLREGDGAGEARVTAETESVRALGLVMPRAFEHVIERLRARGPVPVDAVTPAASTTEALAVGLQRLLVPGAAPALVQRELLSVTAAFFPERSPRLEELDSNREPRALPGSAPVDGATTWIEFGDGAGRRLRLGLPGTLTPTEHGLLASVALVAGAALQIAALRGLSTPKSDRTADPETPVLPGFIAASPAMRRLRADLVRFAGSRATVIITGESGSGKEVVARAIHDLSPRAGHPYVAFNCAAVPRELYEGQLFGHRKGAFTGAISDSPGMIRAADGGTLFLDEIGELPLDVQPKLLRFLENGEISPLGERRPITVDVRIVAATHRDLEALVRKGQFREDLFFRLQVIPVRVPPLRERREDVAALARHFLREVGPKGRTPVLAPDALAALMARDWPGNVRELRNVIERTLAFAPDAVVVTAADLRLA
jgi:tetratricopeptide (TPR) repeat protein